MKQYRAFATVAFSGFLFGDLRKNIPQIVGGIVSKQIVIRGVSDYMPDIYVGTKEEVANYAIIDIDIDTLESELVAIEEYKVNSSMKRPMAYFADLSIAKIFINALTKKGEHNGTAP